MSGGTTTVQEVARTAEATVNSVETDLDGIGVTRLRQAARSHGCFASLSSSPFAMQTRVSITR